MTQSGHRGLAAIVRLLAEYGISKMFEYGIFAILFHADSAAFLQRKGYRDAPVLHQIQHPHCANSIG
jgi:hypothetical protein